MPTAQLATARLATVRLVTARLATARLAAARLVTARLVTARLATVGLLVSACSTAGSGFDVPPDHRLVCTEDFAFKGSIGHFHFSDDNAWKWGMTRGIPGEPLVSYLELEGGADYSPPHRSPLGIALLREQEVGSFVLEAKLLQTGRQYGHRDLCIFFGYQDPAHFYYVHLATTPDSHACNIFLVDGADRRAIAPIPDAGVDWGEDVWHRVRVERSLAGGEIRVYFDDMTTPVLEAVDKTLERGRIGFGSFDDSGRFTDVLLWSPDADSSGLDVDPF